MSEFAPEYLGDGVYCAVERGMLKLMTGSHDNPDNTIYLEQRVWENLLLYNERAEDWYRAQQEKGAA